MKLSFPSTEKGMSRYLLFSLLLHGSFVLPWLLLQLKPQPSISSQLAVEMYGMVSDRQTEARQAAAEQRQAPVQPQRKEPPKHWVTTKAESSVQQTQRDEPEKPVPETPVVANNKASDQQIQRQLSVQDKNLDEMKRYLAKIKKKLQNHLVYPQEAKSKAYEGAPVVKFTITETGTILPGSLSVLKSSGYAILDANALQATQASAPFDRPSHNIEVAIAVAFSLKN